MAAYDKDLAEKGRKREPESTLQASIANQTDRVVMANSKYEYVKDFERPDPLLPNTWVIIRIDGHGFHRFSKVHEFEKPNDARALNLMNAAAKAVMSELSDVVMAYGDSDEYSFLLSKLCSLYDRRESKLITTFASLFTSYYLYYWSDHFPTPKPLYPPSFDGRAVLYPSDQNLRDYFSWRQADCHINNLYNTTNWALILKGGMTERDAERELMGSRAADKHEILFSRFGINYNNEPEMYKKGTVMVREPVKDEENGDAPSLLQEHGATMGEPERPKSNRQLKKEAKKQAKKEERQVKTVVRVYHCDVIRDEFWDARPWILGNLLKA
ncbi:tRNAHis guanylyltransferase [Saitoella complicata NRRL Y-17804]|uniref:tRNAHis guanylyltransferase n=1 Tax=Saitoella complicata (strain BCRC 22490 / CBS 7301 / JCM 7358 / NBRC 10748 / NRRL Y-17804) TaxID=698492 RepID=UPI00086739B9|nr:tRNAHis guanylyltransferase [Saitoella complicata NRRL Y-17804]ODQ51348.1 tRNAHis guanylyltransferase [Saitoella complicata NRRL Y-17804]